LRKRAFAKKDTKLILENLTLGNDVRRQVSESIQKIRDDAVFDKKLYKLNHTQEVEDKRIYLRVYTC